jgi:hypothetical protein
MPIGQKCAACGCIVPEAQLKSGKAVLKGTRLYCAECASLILEPSDVARKDSKLKMAPAKAQSVGSASRRSAGASDEWKAKARVEDSPAASRIRSAGSNRMPAVGTSAKGSGRIPSPKISSRGMPSPNASRTNPKGSARLKAAPPPVENVPEIEQNDEPETAHQEANKPPSRQDIHAHSRRGAKNSNRVPPHLRKTASAKLPDQPRSSANDDADDAAEVLDPATKKSSSRRMHSVGSSRSNTAAPSSRASSRMKVDSKMSSSRDKSGRNRDSREDAGRSQRSPASVKEGMSPMVMGGIGVAVLVLLGMLAMVGGGAIIKKKEAAKAADAPLEELHDNTPAEVWAQRGDEWMKRGERQKAADAYTRAGEAADRRSPGAGQNYTMRAYDIRKFTTLPQSH